MTTATVEAIEVQEVTKEEAKNILRAGHFATITFIKRDGTERILNGRCGVHKYTKGGSLGYNADEKDIVILYESNTKNTEKAPYRAVKLDSVINFKTNHHTYTISNKQPTEVL